MHMEPSDISGNSFRPVMMADVHEMKCLRCSPLNKAMCNQLSTGALFDGWFGK